MKESIREILLSMIAEVMLDEENVDNIVSFYLCEIIDIIDSSPPETKLLYWRGVIMLIIKKGTKTVVKINDKDGDSELFSSVECITGLINEVIVYEFKGNQRLLNEFIKIGINELEEILRCVIIVEVVEW